MTVRFYKVSTGFDAYRGAEPIGRLTVRPAPAGIEFHAAQDGQRIAFGSVSAAMTALRRLYRAVLPLVALAWLLSACGGQEEPLQPSVVGYFAACATAACQSGLACMSDGNQWPYVCVWPVNPEACGDIGQPCCVTRNQDGSIAPPCRAPGQCEQWCLTGLRCDGSHRTTTDNICTID